MPNKKTKKILFMSGFRPPSVEWSDYRFDFYLNHTVKSLLGQTNKNFECWLLTNISDDMVKLYQKKLPDNRFKIVKKIDTSYPLMRFNDKDKYLFDKWSPYDFYLFFRVDSDDMLEYSVCEELQAENVFNDNNIKYDFFQYQKGYKYDTVKDNLFHWHHGSPPFYARVLDADEFKDIENSHLKTKGHSLIGNFHRKILSINKFLVLIHNMNDGSDGNVKNNKIIGMEKNNVLNKFGVR